MGLAVREKVGLSFVRPAGKGALRVRTRRALELALLLMFLLLAGFLAIRAAFYGPAELETAADPALQAAAYVMPNWGWAPLTAYFSAYGSGAADGRALRFSWDLDANGSFETDATGSQGYASTTYTKPGSYQVGLRVSDDQGNSAFASTTVEVRHPGASSVDIWAVFDDSQVRRVELVLSREAWERLWADPEAKIEVEADVILWGQRVERVGLSMKGNASLGASGAKKPWKLDFNAFVEGQDFEGLTMLLLHNGFGDPSMLREKLAHEMLHFAGVPAGQVSYVAVWIDLEDDQEPAAFWGVYAMVERPDRVLMGNRFGRGNDSGNLYKADAWFEEGAADLAYYGPAIEDYPMPRGRVAYRKMTNEDEADYRDIIALCAAIDGAEYDSPEAFAEAVEGVMNVDGFLRYLAVIWTHLDLDSYPYTGNNYYLYHHPGTDRFEWIAWDMNSAWGLFGGGESFPLYGSETSMGPLAYAPLYRKSLEVARYRQDYRAYVDLLLRNWFNEEQVGALARRYQELLSPALQQAGGDRGYFGPDAMFGIEDFERSRAELVELTGRRAAFLRAALAQEE